MPGFAFVRYTVGCNETVIGMEVTQADVGSRSLVLSARMDPGRPGRRPEQWKR